MTTLRPPRYSVKWKGKLSLRTVLPAAYELWWWGPFSLIFYLQLKHHTWRIEGAQKYQLNQWLYIELFHQCGIPWQKSYWLYTDMSTCLGKTWKEASNHLRWLPGEGRDGTFYSELQNHLAMKIHAYLACIIYKEIKFFSSSHPPKKEKHKRNPCMTNTPYWIMRIQESLDKESLVTHNLNFKLINVGEVAQHWLPLSRSGNRWNNQKGELWMIIIKGLKLEIRELPAFASVLY